MENPMLLSRRNMLLASVSTLLCGIVVSKTSSAKNFVVISQRELSDKHMGVKNPPSQTSTSRMDMFTSRWNEDLVLNKPQFPIMFYNDSFRSL